MFSSLKPIYSLLNQGAIVIDVTNYIFGKVNNQMNFNFFWKDFQTRKVVRSWNLQTKLKYPYCTNYILGELEIIMTCNDDHLDKI
jgi:hypothetical protein